MRVPAELLRPLVYAAVLLLGIVVMFGYITVENMRVQIMKERGHPDHAEARTRLLRRQNRVAVLGLLLLATLIGLFVYMFSVARSIA